MVPTTLAIARTRKKAWNDTESPATTPAELSDELRSTRAYNDWSPMAATTEVRVRMRMEPVEIASAHAGSRRMTLPTVGAAGAIPMDFIPCPVHRLTDGPWASGLQAGRIRKRTACDTPPNDN